MRFASWGPSDAGSVNGSFVVKLANDGTLLWAKTFPLSALLDVATDASGAIVAVGMTGGADFGGGIVGPGPLFLKFAPDGRHLVSRSYSGTLLTIAHAVAIDPTGGAFVLGQFQGTLSLGSNMVTAADGAPDVFLVKVDGVGQPIWSKRFGAPGNDFPIAVFADGAGGVVFAQRFFSAVDFGGGYYVRVSGWADSAIVKLDSNGAFRWGRHLAGVLPTALAGLPSGDFMVAGQMNGAFTFTSGPVQTVPNQVPDPVTGTKGDAFFARFRADGTDTWACTYGDVYPQSGVSAYLSATGAMRATGTYSGSLDFRVDGGTLPPVGRYDSELFLVQFGAQ